MNGYSLNHCTGTVLWVAPRLVSNSYNEIKSLFLPGLVWNSILGQESIFLGSHVKSATEAIITTLTSSEPGVS